MQAEALYSAGKKECEAEISLVRENCSEWLRDIEQSVQVDTRRGLRTDI